MNISVAVGSLNKYLIAKIIAIKLYNMSNTCEIFSYHGPEVSKTNKQKQMDMTFDICLLAKWGPL